MRLSAEAGLNAAPVALRRVAGKDVLLVERFDREKGAGGWRRRAMVSALTMLALDEMMARYASYEDFATLVRRRFTAPRKTLHELFARMLFNILSGNTDDHARNHAAFLGRAKSRSHAGLRHLPAGPNGPRSQPGYAHHRKPTSEPDRGLPSGGALVSAFAARRLGRGGPTNCDDQRSMGPRVCDDADLSEVDRRFLWRRQFLNPFAFDGAPEELARLVS